MHTYARTDTALMRNRRYMRGILEERGQLAQGRCLWMTFLSVSEKLSPFLQSAEFVVQDTANRSLANALD